MNSKDITRLNYQMIFEEAEPQKDNMEAEKKLAEAEELLHERESQWKEKLKKVREDAYQNGFKDGRKEGFEEATAELDEKIIELEKAFNKSHQQWLETQESLIPYLMGLVFDITEKIIGAKPARDSRVVEKLENELHEVLQKMGHETKPVLYINEVDAALTKKLVKQYNDELTVKVQVKDSCKPGEFILENGQAKVVRNFKILLNDFKKSLSIPDWP